MVFPGTVALAVVLGLTIGTVAVVWLRADKTGTISSSDLAAIRFTLWQALISATISVAAAVPVARALARQTFPGRRLLITLLGAPFILPVIVAVLGLLAVFGRSGILSTIAGWFGLPPVQIYGLHGVVLAHVFFNLPLATRLLLQGWLAVPAEQFRLASSLGFSGPDIRRVIERPILKEVLPGAFMLIFVLCTTSFAVVLALGGGPRATTVELAIYQAFRFDFDLGHAAFLALVQFAICAVAAALSLISRVPQAQASGLDRVVPMPKGGIIGRIADAVWIILSALFLLVPLAMIVLRGLPALGNLPQTVVEAASRSLLMAISSAALVVVWALAIAFFAQAMRGRLAAGMVEGTGYLTIAASPLVMGTGLYLVVFPIADPVRLALPITVVVNAAMSLPFALRSVVPAIEMTEKRFGLLADSLGLSGWSRLRFLHWPRLRRATGFAAGLTAALSMGDLGVIALFADPEQATLPLQLYRLMASYRMQEASAAALLLLALSLALFWAFDRGGRLGAEN